MNVGIPLGKVFIYIAFVSIFISFLSYLSIYIRKRRSLLSQSSVNDKQPSRVLRAKSDLEKLKKVTRKARLFYHISSISIIASSLFLLYMLISHQYQYSYVWEHSSNDLPFLLLVSAFFAGQEGSFLLWTLFTVLSGIVLLNSLSKINSPQQKPNFLKGKNNTEFVSELKSDYNYEELVMSVFTFILFFLMLLVILKSPFQYIWVKYPNEVREGFFPADGNGLNPILQNFWMVIHPPILFIGFATMSAPFSFAIASLLMGARLEQKPWTNSDSIPNPCSDFSFFGISGARWINYALPWLIFSSLTLGAGIILGGYWAYGVLGWGGYWGWDPVENSSLIPWFFSIAAIHTILSQKTTGKFLITNYILVILSFLFVLYSTFLTRSGVLSEASVHSFTQPGTEVYIALILFILIFFLISLFLLLAQFKNFLKRRKLKIKTTEQPKTILSRESGLYLGALILCISAVIIIAGTSMPIFTNSAVEPPFYNRMMLPFAVLILLSVAFVIYLDWNPPRMDFKKYLKKILIPFVIAIILTVILIFSGIKKIDYIFLAFSSVFAFVVSVLRLIELLKKFPPGQKSHKLGAVISHIGVSLMLLGIITSGGYSIEKKLTLELYKPVSEFGYTFTYMGAEMIPGPDPSREEKYNLVIKAKQLVSGTRENEERISSEPIVLKPVVSFNNVMNNRMFTPDIAHFLTKDLYIEPLDVMQPEMFSGENIIEIRKGESKRFKNFNIKFIGFTGSPSGMSLGSNSPGGAPSESNEDLSGGMSKNFVVTAILVIDDGRTIDTLYPQMKISDGKPSYIPAQMKENKSFDFILADMNINPMSQRADSSVKSSISLAVIDVSSGLSSKEYNQPEETLIVNIYIKPFINVLWIGTILMIVGFFFALYHRTKRTSFL